MMKTILSHVSILFVVSFIATNSNAQSIKKLHKSVQKSDYEKLIALSQKRIKKGMSDSVSYYYLTMGYLIKARHTNDNIAERSFYRATRQYENFSEYIDSMNRVTSLDELILSTGHQVYHTLSTKKKHRRKHYALFFSAHFGDTVADYDELFAVKTKGTSGQELVESEFVQTRSTETATLYRQGLKYSIPKEIPSGQILIKSAEEVLGTPWIWAGTEPGKGFDCSGFVIWAYGEFGYELPHRTKLLAKIGKPVASHEVRESDLVCFGSNEYNPHSVWHIGMVHSINDDEIHVIHCATSIGVSVAPLHKGYWSEVAHFFVRIE